MAYKGTKKKLPPTNFFLSNRYVGLFPAVITLLVYLPALRNGFVNWDDQLYVYENWNIQSIDSRFFEWLLTAVVSANWHPLTMLSLAMDYAIWGLNPFGYHLTNIILHSLNTFLVFVLAYRLVECGLTQNSKFKNQNVSLITASVTALLFGIHPLHVESVAWISERKDVLYAFFYLISLIAYLEYIYSKGLKKFGLYYAALFTFALAILSKPMAISLPIVLLIIDYYPLKRFGPKNVLLEKAPFFLISLLSSIVTIWAQHFGGAIKAMDAFPLLVRMFSAVRGYIFYIVKMFAPVNLAPFYPYPETIRILSFEYMGSLILLSTITILVLRLKQRIFQAAWSYYLLSLLPVIGLVQVGDHSAADRYTYLPSLGPFLLMGIGVGLCFGKTKRKTATTIITAITATILCLLAGMTVRQISVWHDSILLWSHEIKLFPKTDMPYNIRGLAYHTSGNYQAAINDYNKAVELNPEYVEAYNNRASSYLSSGNFQAAISDYDTILKLNPEFAPGYYNRGAANYSMGSYKEAIMDYARAIELNPLFADAYNNRAAAYYAIGKYREALQDYDKAIELDPGDAAAKNNRETVIRMLNPASGQ